MSSDIDEEVESYSSIDERDPKMVVESEAPAYVNLDDPALSLEAEAKAAKRDKARQETKWGAH